MEPIRSQKKLVLEPLGPKKTASRLYSTLMNHLGVAVAYIYNNYGEKSATRLWEFMTEAAEVSQGKRRNESFEDFVKRRVEEDMVLGIEHQVSEFYDDKFASYVKNCKLKTIAGDRETSPTRFHQELPCMLCQSTWQGSSRAMGYQIQITKDGDGCRISLEKASLKR